MKLFLLGFILVISPMTVMAATYKWVDDKGTVSFVDELGKVPKQYRMKAVLLDSEAAPVEITESAPKQDSEGAKGKSGNAVPGVHDRSKPMFGGKSEDAWRKEFSNLNADIKANEEQLADLKARVADTSKMSRGEFLSIQNSIKNTEISISRLKQKLEQLSLSADKVKVPENLRSSE